MECLSDVASNDDVKLTSFPVRSGLLLCYTARREDHYPTTYLRPSHKHLVFGEEVEGCYAGACCHTERSQLAPGQE